MQPFSYERKKSASKCSRLLQALWKGPSSSPAERWVRKGLVLAFDLSQLITWARSFGAILFSFDTELDSVDGTPRIHNLDDSTGLAVAGMFELVGEIVLVEGIGLNFVNMIVKILDFRPALRLRDDGI